MTTTKIETLSNYANNQIMITNTKPPKKPPATAATAATTRLVCFSFAAYAKNLIDRLRSSDVPVAGGLSDVEFTSVESVFGFSFPPDLRAILREGLPVGSGFPNWRSSSPQQLHILVNLPIRNLLKQVSHRNFWSHSWGPHPGDINRALEIAKHSLYKQSPSLVPIYRNCYIPTSPIAAGNPVFFVDAETVRILSFDIAGFFQEFEFLKGGSDFRRRSSSPDSAVNAPVWAAKTARRIGFWTEAAERPRLTDARGAWWNGGDLGSCLEEVFWRLKEGGWKEEEVREMLMMDGCDDRIMKRETSVVERQGEGMSWHVGTLSFVLLRAGWTTEDVVDSLHLQNDKEEAVVLTEKNQYYRRDQNLVWNFSGR